MVFQTEEGYFNYFRSDFHFGPMVCRGRTNLVSQIERYKQGKEFLILFILVLFLICIMHIKGNNITYNVQLETIVDTAVKVNFVQVKLRLRFIYLFNYLFEHTLLKQWYTPTWRCVRTTI